MVNSTNRDFWMDWVKIAIPLVLFVIASVTGSYLKTNDTIQGIQLDVQALKSDKALASRVSRNEGDIKRMDEKLDTIINMLSSKRPL